MKDSTKAILIATILTFIVFFEVDSIAITIPSISRSFNLDSITTIWISIAYLLTCACTGLLFGKIIPKHGLVKTTKVCLIMVLTGTVLASIAMNPYLIIIGKGIEGLAAGGLGSALYLFVTNYVNPSKIGRGFGISTSGGFIGALLAPVIAGAFTYYLSWRFVMGFTIPFTITGLVLLFTLKEEIRSEVEFNRFSAFVWFIIMFLFVYGVSFLDTTLGQLLLIISLIILSIFLYFEVKNPNPLYNFRLLKNKEYFINNYNACISVIIKCGFIFVLTLYLNYVKLLNSMEIGIIIGLIEGIMIILCLYTGKLCDGHNTVKISNYGLLIMAVSALMLCFSNDMSTFLVLVLLTILSVGYTLVEVSNKKIIIEISDKKDLAQATSFLSSIRDIGAMLPPVILTLVLSIFGNINNSQIEYWSISSEWMFIIFFILSITMFIASMYLNKDLSRKYDNNSA